MPLVAHELIKLCIWRFDHTYLIKQGTFLVDILATPQKMVSASCNDK